MKVVFAETTPVFTITGKVPDDRMKLFVDVEKIAEGLVKSQDILDAITKYAPNAPLHLGVIDDIAECANKDEKVEERRVAKGRPASNGINGKLILLVKKFDHSREAAVDARGFTQFRDLHLFDNVRDGQVIGRVYPPQVGKDGYDALGNELKGEMGEPFKLTPNKTIEIRKADDSSKRYQVVIAKKNGLVKQDRTELEIIDELRIKGNLDYHYGNIDFVGQVIITGSVFKGFRVEAEEGITIQGTSSGAHLASKSGDIEIKKFAFGGLGSRIIAGQNLRIFRAQELQASVAGSLVVGKELLDSVLRVEQVVYAKSARVIGGEMYSAAGIEAKEFGNEAGARTALFICSDVEMSTEYLKLRTLLKSHQNALALIKLHMGPYHENPERIKLLNPEHRIRMTKFHDKLQMLRKSYGSLELKRERLMEGANPVEVIRINVHKMLYPGTVLQAGEEVFEPKEPIKGPKTIEFDRDKGEFVVGELVPFPELEG